MSALYTLLLVLSLFCSSVAMFGPAGVFVFILAGLLPLLLYLIRSPVLAFFCYITILLFIALLLPAVSVAREAARACQCRNNLKQLCFALLNYEQHHGQFPPAAVKDDTGKPVHSWRVLILPFIEGETLYQQYDFNEPWDGPNNKKLLSMRPEGFGCPSDGNAYMYDATCTSYLAVIGPGTAWSQLVEGRSVDSDSDEEDKSILLVETTDANIGWTEPRDLNLNELNSPDSPQISSKHMRNNGFFYHESPRGAHVTLGDGIVWLLPAEAIKSDKLIDLLAAGGYNKKIISSIDTSETLRIHWPHCVAFAVWLVSLVLLLHWAVRCGGRTKNPSDQADRVGPHQLV